MLEVCYFLLNLRIDFTGLQQPLLSVAVLILVWFFDNLDTSGMHQISLSIFGFSVLQEFNAGLFDYLIATDNSEIKEKEQPKAENNSERKKSRKQAKAKLDSEFGVVRGIDFKNVHTVWQTLYIVDLVPFL